MGLLRMNWTFLPDRSSRSQGFKSSNLSLPEARALQGKAILLGALGLNLTVNIGYWRTRIRVRQIRGWHLWIVTALGKSSLYFNSSGLLKCCAPSLCALICQLHDCVCMEIMLLTCMPMPPPYNYVWHIRIFWILKKDLHACGLWQLLTILYTHRYVNSSSKLNGESATINNSEEVSLCEVCA